MKTIELTVEEAMLAEVDEATRALEMTREDFVRTALERALRQQEIIALEQRHARGYERRPQTAEEVGEWEDEQVWGEP
ncbi:MAG TPA: ribbon-helix-helix protein, CopG family [Pyrinomonadaceae bacterium]|jgi:metal-responsive CopG/Arc/MetJ family transcriptional regulator|nr:ribbon-helix-helix protein, CopG family [Pyrinomonadaceae bacterium]